jgi:hypothetical protein
MQRAEDTQRPSLSVAVANQPSMDGCGSARQPLGGRGDARSTRKASTARLALATAIDADDQKPGLVSVPRKSNGSGSGSITRRRFGGGVNGRGGDTTAAAARAVRPHSPGQLRAIYAEGRRRGLDNDDLHDSILSGLAQNSIARKTGSFSDLTYTEAQRAIQRLKGRDFTPLRTRQHQRQTAGINQVITDEQQQLIADLASQRNWSAQTLITFCKRQCGHYPLRTTKDANKVIEPLKAMNKRENLWAA